MREFDVEQETMWEEATSAIRAYDPVTGYGMQVQLRCSVFGVEWLQDVWGAGCRVQGAGCRVQGVGCMGFMARPLPAGHAPVGEVSRTSMLFSFRGVDFIRTSIRVKYPGSTKLLHTWII